VDDAGLPRLAAFLSLEYLGLDETKITDAGLKPLRRFAGLRQLHVEKNRVVLLTLRVRPNLTRSVRSTIESPSLIDSAIPRARTAQGRPAGVQVLRRRGGEERAGFADAIVTRAFLVLRGRRRAGRRNPLKSANRPHPRPFSRRACRPCEHGGCNLHNDTGLAHFTGDISSAAGEPFRAMAQVALLNRTAFVQRALFWRSALEKTEFRSPFDQSIPTHRR
jgi:hypothetical protein